MKKFIKVLETTRQLSIAYHSQTDGQIERINQEIGIFLWHYINYQQDNWMEQLAAMEFQYNGKRYVATGRISFKLNFGRYLWKGNLVVQSEIPKVKEFLAGLQKSWKQATKAIEEAQKNMKRQFDKKRQNLQGLKIGDNMWLENKNIQLN